MSCLTFFSILLFAHVATPTPHEECQGLPSYVSVKLGDCTAEPCPLKRGSVVKFQLQILAHHYITSFTASVMAHALGTDVHYPLPQEDVCAGLTDGECPLDKGEIVTYSLDFPVLDSFPTVPVLATFTVTSDKGIEGCMKIALAVVD